MDSFQNKAGIVWEGIAENTAVAKTAVPIKATMMLIRTRPMNFRLGSITRSLNHPRQPCRRITENPRQEAIVSEMAIYQQLAAGPTTIHPL